MKAQKFPEIIERIEHVRKLLGLNKSRFCAEDGSAGKKFLFLPFFSACSDLILPQLGHSQMWCSVTGPSGSSTVDLPQSSLGCGPPSLPWRPALKYLRE